MVDRSTVMSSPGTGMAGRRAAVPFIVGVLAGILLVCLAIAALFWPRSVVVEQFTEPASVVKPDGRMRYLTVRQERSLWRVLTDGVSGQETHYLVAGSDPSGSYGHRLELDATGVDTGNVQVRWMPDGARISYGTLDSDQLSHEVFVPAQSYRYGR